MPKIRLKPGSPEYADSSAKPQVHVCEMPGCAAHAHHKAPKHRALNEYYHFCLDHAREYNKAWDFFDGMAAHEVQDHIYKSHYGDRPTWKYGVNGEDPEDILRSKAWSFYEGDEEKSHENRGRNHNQGFATDQNSAEFEALAIMGLSPPVTLATIKTRYKELAKKHHPDLNQGCEKSEELLKRINMSYTILKLAYDEFDKLPERH
jgi:hypothetical protein